MMRAVLHAMAEHVYDATLGDLTLQAGEELTPSGAVVIEIECLCDFRLCSA